MSTVIDNDALNEFDEVVRHFQELLWERCEDFARDHPDHTGVITIEVEDVVKAKHALLSEPSG